MSEEPNNVDSFVAFSQEAEKVSTDASPPHDASKESKKQDVKSSPESTASKEKTPKKKSKIIKQKSGGTKKTPEESKKSPEDAKQMIEVADVAPETEETVKDDVKSVDVNETSVKEDDIRETRESLEEAEKKANDDFTAASEHILSSPSDLCEVVSSFENLQPIYGSEALNFRSDDENSSSVKDEKEKSADEKNQTKTDDKKVKNSPKSDKDKSTKSEKKEDAEWEMKRDRRKSSVLTDADVTRKSSEEPYPIGIPLRKKVNKSTRKKLWREIQKRKPFISANVYAHIQHFAKPPFQTWGCHNCTYRKDMKSYSYEFWNT